jgi:hypothetical protein
MGHVWRATSGSRVRIHGCLVLLLCALTGCGGGSAPPQPDVEVRISKLLHLYQAYVQKNQKGPPNEDALREFGKGLSAKEREDFAIGDDVENIFTSPRDNQKFVVQYNIKIEPSRAKAFIWEATGQGGMRFVALTNFYIVQYDEAQLAEAKK